MSESILGYFFSEKSSMVPPMAMIYLADIIAVQPWYTSDGTFWYPKIFTVKGTYWTECFSDYAKALKQVGLPEPSPTLIQPDSPYFNQWKRFVESGGKPPQK